MNFEPNIKIDPGLSPIRDGIFGSVFTDPKISKLFRPAAMFDIKSLPDFRLPQLPNRKFASHYVYALSGGGALGSFQVGAIIYLIQHFNFHPRGIAGNSVGTVNSVATAESSFEGFEKLKQTWLLLKNQLERCNPCRF